VHADHRGSSSERVGPPEHASAHPAAARRAVRGSSTRSRSGTRPAEPLAKPAAGTTPTGRGGRPPATSRVSYRCPTGVRGPNENRLTCGKTGQAVRGGGASKSQPRPTIAGRPIYLGGRKPAIPTCRDEVVAAVEALVAGGGAPVFTVEVVHAAMDSCGSAWSRETVAKTMLRMTRPARRPPYLQLERAEPDLYRVVPAREELGRS